MGSLWRVLLGLRAYLYAQKSKTAVAWLENQWPLVESLEMDLYRQTSLRFDSYKFRYKKSQFFLCHSLCRVISR